MTFIQLWFTGYANPARFAERLRDKPAPLWGLYATLLRGALDSLLLYLPVHLLGRSPLPPSYITLLPTQGYYATLVWVAPLFFLLQWLAGAGVMHITLRALRRPSDIDQLLNLTGFATLVVGAFLLAWDWAWIWIGGMDYITLGLSHLAADAWWWVLVVVGLKRLLNTPAWLALLLNALGFAISLPLAMLFMRSPL